MSLGSEITTPGTGYGVTAASHPSASNILSEISVSAWPRPVLQNSWTEIVRSYAPAAASRRPPPRDAHSHDPWYAAGHGNSRWEIFLVYGRFIGAWSCRVFKQISSTGVIRLKSAVRARRLRYGEPRGFLALNVTTGGAQARLEDYGLSQHCGGDRVLVEAGTVAEAGAQRPGRRTVVKRGRIVARDGVTLP